MANRREFIQNSFAATLLAGIGYIPGASGRENGGRVPLYKAIYDERFADSRRFADEARALGVTTQAIRGDITDLWFHDLDARWREDQVAVAGLTTQAALFCLERFSWDHQMRVVFRAEHELLESGCIEHTVTCSGRRVEQIDQLQREGGRWASQMAHVLRQIPADHQADISRTFITPLSGPTHESAELLVSWVIAPRARLQDSANQEQQS